uniref:Retrotransposable element Tf2 n=1 Tax=Cajanus cajan TaxID=3821 RepID=A0A151TIL9_CAJCA|nr:Retrotransposable element Tf2 [Cajanus cajan]
MCTDYSDLNKACPKDAYPLPCIDRLVDGASGHAVFSFLDAYSGYNQINMHPADEEKTAFITENANFCYRVMSFGLKNVGATYQRLMDKVFQGQIGRNIEIYVDDMVVKSGSLTDHMADLAEIFDELRKHNMRLNPEKCNFGVRRGKFLGFTLSTRGIKANRDKCQAVLEMIGNFRVVTLRHYFQSHLVVVHTDCLISKVLRKPKLAGRMMAWSVELSQFDITYRPRGPIKAQCLVDFVNELHPHSYFEEQWWILHVDGSSNRQGSGAGVILEGPRGITLEQSLRFRFKASNNQAEYEALLTALRLAEDMGASRIKCLTDSKVVAEQVGGSFQVKDHNMIRYYHAYQKLKTKFQEVLVEHIPRENNARADQLARLAATKKPGQLRTIIQQEISHPSVDEEMIATVDTDQNDHNNPSDWRDKIKAFINDCALPADLLKCLAPTEAEYVIREVHEGICGTHSGARTTVAKILRAGYYWPTMNTDCDTFVKKCQPCQKHGNLIHQPAEQLHCIPPAWSFATWGADILGPFPTAKGQCKFLIVAVDLFTKWIEVEPLACISAHQVQKFLWKNVITQFGVPHTLLTDNGLQFADRKLNEFLAGLGVQHKVTSVEPPQTNGQAESANKVILAELKKWLGEAKGAWAEQLPKVVWAYRCTPQSTTLETPFRLVYGSMIPVEIGEPSFRRVHFNEAGNEAELRTNLNVIEEIRDRALVIAEATKQRYKRRFDSKVKPREFREGDLVWRATGEARKNPRQGKLAPNCDGPYRVRHNLNNGAYKLEYLSGEPILRTWNSSHLKVYYS